MTCDGMQDLSSWTRDGSPASCSGEGGKRKKKLLERNSQDDVVLKKTWGGKEVKEREVER